MKSQSDNSEDMNPMKKRRQPVGIYLAVLAILAIAVMGILPRLSLAKKLENSVAATKELTETVTVVPLKSIAGASELALPSSLQAIEETTINVRAAGYVKQRFVDIGSHVHAGDVLAEIESPEIDQQLLQSESEVSNAKAAVGQATANVSKSLAATEGARSELIRYQANQAEAIANLAHVRAQYAQAVASVDGAKARLMQVRRRLEGYRAELKRTRVEQELAGKTLARWKELEKADAVSGQEVDEKQSVFDSSREKVNVSEAQVNSGEADVQAAQEAVTGAQAELLAAKADISSGEQRVEAAKAAVNMSKANIQASLASHQASMASVDAAKAVVGSNQAIVRRYAAVQSYEKVIAPFSGVITARNVEVGDLVSPSGGGTGASDQMATVTKTGLFGLARTDSIRAQLSVPESAVTSIHLGQEAVISVQELPGKTFTGSVTRVSGALDSTSRTLMVEVEIPNPTGLLKPGMYAQLSLKNMGARSTIRIPASTLIFDARGNRVAEVKPDMSVHFISVQVGRDFGDEIEVVQGLNGTEELIMNPSETLKEGQHVRPIHKGQ